MPWKCSVIPITFCKPLRSASLRSEVRRRSGRLSSFCIAFAASNEFGEVRVNEVAVIERIASVRRGRRLEYFTIAWNTIEGLVAVVTGAVAGNFAGGVRNR